MEILFKTLNPKSIYEKMDAVEVLTAETIKNLNTKILEALMKGSLNTDMEFMSESNALLDKIKEVKITLEIKNAEPNFFLDQEAVQDFFQRMIKKKRPWNIKRLLPATDSIRWKIFCLRILIQNPFKVTSWMAGKHSSVILVMMGFSMVVMD